MSRLFILLPFLILQINFTYTQIPNGGFEHWVQESNYERPTDWQTNQSSDYRRFEKDTIAVEGNYSLKIISDVTDPFEICESFAYTRIELTEPLPFNSILEFYVKIVPLDTVQSEFVFLKVITAIRQGGPVISNSIYECYIPIETFTKIELPLNNEGVDVLEIGIAGGAKSGDTDEPCFNRSITWIDGMNIRSVITETTPSNLLNPDIHIFPNPSNGRIEIISSLDQTIQYELYSNIGQLVTKGQITGSSLNIFQPGTYLLKLMVSQGTQHTYVTKIIVVN